MCHGFVARVVSIWLTMLHSRFLVLYSDPDVVFQDDGPHRMVLSTVEPSGCNSTSSLSEAAGRYDHAANHISTTGNAF